MRSRSASGSEASGPTTRIRSNLSVVLPAKVTSSEPTQACEVEVEGVVEANGRASGKPVDLDDQSAASPLLYEREQELVPASVRWRRELVEDREVGTSPARAQPVGLRMTASSQDARRPPDLGGCERLVKSHPARLHVLWRAVPSGRPDGRLEPWISPEKESHALHPHSAALPFGSCR